MNQSGIVSIIVILLLISSGFSSITGSAPASAKGQDESCFGFIINVTGDQFHGTQTNITRVINKLLHQNVSVYWIASDIIILAQGLKNDSTPSEHFFKKGSFLIPLGNTPLLQSAILSSMYIGCLAEKLDVYTLMQPVDNILVYQLVAPRIACYNGTGIDYIFPPRRFAYAGFEHITSLNPHDIISTLSIDNYDVVVWGAQIGSTAEVLSDIFSPLGLQVRKTIRTFVEQGGGYIGFCYGGWRAASGYRRPYLYPIDLSYSPLLSFVPIQLRFLECPVYRALPGGGKVTLRIVNHDSPITFGLSDNLTNMRYYAGPMFLNSTKQSSTMEPIAVLSEIEQEDWRNDFNMKLVLFWNNRFLSNDTKNHILQTWMNRSIGATLWITQTLGKGKVIAFGVHPEYTWGGDAYQHDSSAPRIMYNSIWYATTKNQFSLSIDTPTSFSFLPADAGGPYSGAINKHIQFHGSAEGGVPPYTWNWEFELPSHDYFYYPLNNTRQEQNPWFNYSKSGIYQVYLVVADSIGNVGYDVTSVKIG